MSPGRPPKLCNDTSTAAGEPMSEKQHHRAFHCKQPECNGLVYPQGVPRYFYHREIHILVPEQISLPRCNKCGTDFMTDDAIAMIGQILESEYKRHDGLIRSIKNPSRRPAWVS
jgi:hypothetical protein